MIRLSTIKNQINDNELFYSECCHKHRPDGHICKGVLQMEHPFSRACGGDNKSLLAVVVPVCSSCNYSPDKKTKAWSKLVAIDIYGITQLAQLCYKKDWEGELRLSRSYFI